MITCYKVKVMVRYQGHNKVQLYLTLFNEIPYLTE